MTGTLSVPVAPDAVRRPSIVAVSGSPTSPSRTSVLVARVADAFAHRLDGDATVIELAPLLGELGGAPFRADLGRRTSDALELVEAADIVVVGSPAYRATYTGLFKLFFDHVGQYALVDKPVVLTATGGSNRHALLVEHQMRPLFGFFQALTLPLGIFASQDDFENYTITSEDLAERIRVAVERTVPVVAARLGYAQPTWVEHAARPDVF